MISSKTLYCSRTLLVLVLLPAILAAWGCNPKEPGSLHPNERPIIRLAKGHILPGDTLPNPRITLDWVGDDPDGYVVGYKYYFSNDVVPPRILLNIMEKGFALMAVTSDPKLIPDVYKYFSTLPLEGLDQARTDTLARGDSITVAGVKVYASNSDSIRITSIIESIVRETNPYPIHSNPNKGTFLLDSPDPYNHIIFDIVAIDKSGDTSGIPGLFDVWTTQVAKPHVGIDQTPATDTSFVMVKKTDVYPGLYFHFSGNDPNSRTIEYSWVVDRDLWPDSIPWSGWSPIPSAYVSAEDFPPSQIFAVKHSFYVRARSEFGVISDDSSYIQNAGTIIPAYKDFYTIFPAFRQAGYHQKILLLNNCYGPPDAQPAYVGTPPYPDRDTVDSFYREVFRAIGKPDSAITFYHLQVDNFPSMEFLGTQSLVVIYGDAIDQNGKTRRTLRGTEEFILRSYCGVGGNLIVGGWGVNHIWNLAPGNFWDDVIHVSQTRPDVQRGNGADFLRAEPLVSGYPVMELDSAKLDPAWNGLLFQTGWIGTTIRVAYPVGFGETLYKYHGAANNPEVEGNPIAVRYLTYGVSEDYFNCFFLGFPLYYMQRPGVDQLLSRALNEMGQ